MNDDNPTLPLPRQEETPEPRRRSWRGPALIAGAVIVAAGLTGGTAALAAQSSGTGPLAASTTSAPSADGGSTGAGSTAPTPGSTPSAP
ncbi:hypothetical protein ACFFLN_06730, partial [Microbacterium testaceum]